jgi:hypothetical protein
MAIEWDRLGQPGFDRYVEALLYRTFHGTQGRVGAVNGRAATRASTCRSPQARACGSSS